MSEEIVPKLVARIRQDAAKCDFDAIHDLQGGTNPQSTCTKTKGGQAFGLRGLHSHCKPPAGDTPTPDTITRWSDAKTKW